MSIDNKTLDAYFWKMAKDKKKTLILPFPNAQPKFGNEGEGLVNRWVAHVFASDVLEKKTINIPKHVQEAWDISTKK